jgi:hypothetical protein
MKDKVTNTSSVLLSPRCLTCFKDVLHFFFLLILFRISIVLGSTRLAVRPGFELAVALLPLSAASHPHNPKTVGSEF